MENTPNKRVKISPTVSSPPPGGLSCWRVCAALGIVASYYWRVFYGLDARGLAPLAVTGFLCGTGCAGGRGGVAAAPGQGLCQTGRRLHFAVRHTVCLCKPAAADPDETDHYLRTYAISMGRFDFDAARGYPEDVDELVAAFPGAWVNAHTSAGVGTDPDTHAEQAYNTAGYALKQYGKDGRVESIWDSFYAVSQLGKPRFCGRFRN